MANECHCTLVVKRIDKGSLTPEELGAFIRETDSPECQGTPVEGLDKEYYFSYQFVVPVKQDDNWRENNINARGCKWDGGYYCIGKMDDDKKLILCFATPWCPPSKWLQAVCKKYPELQILLAYDEPLMGFDGDMGRNWEGKLFDKYREGDEYLNTCYECDIKKKDSKYREDFDEMMCDECYNKVLNNNK